MLFRSERRKPSSPPRVPALLVVLAAVSSAMQGSIRGRLTKSMDVNFRSALELMRMMQMMEIA